MAETRLTSSSPTTLADKKQDASSKLDAEQNAELLAYLSSLSADQSPVGQALSQIPLNQVEQGARTAAWSGVIQAIIVTGKLESDKEQRRLEELQNQLALIAEEKKKQRKELDGRETVIFEKLVSILGKPLAEQIALTIDKAITGQGAALQKDPAAVAKLSAQLFALLSSGDTLLKLGTSAQEVERSLQRCFVALERSLTRSQTLPANSLDPIPAVGSDLVASAKTQPQLLVAHLKTQAGIDQLRSYIAAQSSPESRIEALRSLERALGPERFAAVLDSYDRLTGRPLVFDCLQLSANVEVDQRKILQALLDPSRSILNAAQLERLSQFVVSDAAAIMQSLKVEYSHIPQQITQIERQRIESYSHLARALGIETPAGLSVDDARGQFLRAVVEKFPNLAGKSWEEVSKALFDLAGHADTDSFRLGVAKLGASLIPSQLAKTGLANLSEAERQRAYEVAQTEIKELAVRLLTHMEDITSHEQHLGDLREMLIAGPGQEQTKVLNRLEALYSGIISGFSREKVASQGEASRIYIEGLHARIDAATDPVALQALCAERDSLQWRALQIRIATLLDQKPAAIERVTTLLGEFQTAYPTGLRGRSAEFFKAAEDVRQALHATTQYSHEVDRALTLELQKLSEEQISLAKKQQELTELVKAQQIVVDGYVTSWFNNYTQDKKHLDELKQALLEIEQKQRANEQAIERTTEANKEASARPIAGFLYLAQNNLGASSPSEVAAHCALTKNSLNVQATLEAKLQAADDARVKAQSALARLDLVGRAACARRDFAAAASATTTRIQEILLHDRTMQPSPAALQSLRASVPAESSLGRALAAIVGSSRPTHELIDLLFARLSPDDVMRVKAFLLAYDRPELFELIGRDRPTDARAAWGAIAALEQSEQRQELSELLQTLPQLGMLVECQELLASLPAGQGEASLAEYQRLAGSSLGLILLSKAPASEPARSSYLFALCDSPIVAPEDLRSLFPGGVVPADTAERQRAFAEALQRDSQLDFRLPTEFEALIGRQAEERASLQVALSTMIQVGRDAEVEKIRRRLAEMDSQFYRPLQTILAGYSADYVARTGIRERLEGSRDAATEMSKASLLDPYGALAQSAKNLAQMIGRDDVSSAQVLEFIRESNQSSERIMLLEVMYQQYVSSRSFLRLSGDLRQDLGSRKGADQSDQAQYDRLFSGKPEALAGYDLEMLTRGLRTKDPVITGRAILVIQGREFGRDTLRAAIEHSPEMKRLWQEYVATPVSRETVALYNSVMANDRVRVGLISTMNGLAWSVDKGFDAVKSLGQYKDEVQRLGGNAVAATESLALEIYGTSFGQAVVRYAGEIPGMGAQMWSGFVNSEPGAQARAGIALAQQALADGTLNPAKLAELIYMIPVEQRRAAVVELGEFVGKLDQSAVYQDSRSEAVLLEYMRRKGGPTAEADSVFMQAIIADASGVGPALSPEVMRRFKIERERLAAQLDDIAHLGTIRTGTLDQAIDFRNTVGKMDQSAREDRDSRTFGKGRAQTSVDVHARMLLSQNALIRGMQLGSLDIETTKEVMRVRAVVILKDLVAGQERGLSSEHNDRDFGALKRRDVEREWTVVRREEVAKWQRDSEEAQKALANFDWWFEVGHSTLKVAVVIGLGAIPGVGPLAVLGVATAWNVADKAYRVAYRGMSLREATRQFAIEFAIDAVCAGAWKLAIRVPTPWVKHVSQFARDNVVVKNSKILLGKLPGFRPKGEIVNTETFKAIRGFFGQTRLASKVEKIVEKTLTQVNAKIADPLLFAKHVQYSFQRIWLPVRPLDFARLIPGTLNRSTPPVPTFRKGDEPELGGGGVGVGGPGKKTPPGFAIPEIHVQATNKLAPDQISELFDRALRVGNDKVADLTKQVLDVVKGGDTERSLALIASWAQELGIKFTGQTPEALLKEFQGMIDSTRVGALDVSALYPYVPALVFLLGVNPAQLEKSSAAQDWKDYSANFRLFDGMFKFLNPGWAGLWMSYTDNAPTFPPPQPPPAQPPPPPSVGKPGNSGGPGAGDAPRLTLQVELDNQIRRPFGDDEKKADRFSIEQAHTQTYAQAQHQALTQSQAHSQAHSQAQLRSQELAERRAHEQVVAAIDQLFQPQKAGVVQAHSIRQQLENVEQHSDRVQHQQRVSAPTMKATDSQAAAAETAAATTQQEKHKIRLDGITSAIQQSSAATEQHVVTPSRHKASNQVEKEEVMLAALRSREVDAPKMATKQSKTEQVKTLEQEDIRAGKAVSATEPQSATQLQSKSRERPVQNISRIEASQATALKQAGEPMPQQRTAQAQHDVSGARNPSGSNGQTHNVTVSAEVPLPNQMKVPAEIDASALSHHDVTAGAPAQQPVAVRDALDVHVTNTQGDTSDSSESETGQPNAGKKKKKKNALQLREEARLREIIMHQLLTQTLERAKREKLLRMLAALGMTEQEYRAFLTRLHAADAKREDAVKIQEAQKIAVAVETIPQSVAPTMKHDAPKSQKSEGKPLKTRGELFARLRNQYSDKIH